MTESNHKIQELNRTEKNKKHFHSFSPFFLFHCNLVNLWNGAHTDNTLSITKMLGESKARDYDMKLKRQGRLMRTTCTFFFLSQQFTSRFGWQNEMHWNSFEQLLKASRLTTRDTYTLHVLLYIVCNCTFSSDPPKPCLFFFWQINNLTMPSGTANEGKQLNH